jgi:P22_AR N-terminal domain
MIAPPFERCILSEKQEQYQESQALIPIEQQTILFRGLPLVVVRLSDGRPGVVLRWICENLHIDPAAQVARIKRTEAIAEDLVYVQVQTEGGFQTMPTLVLDSAPYWLATIDTKRVKDTEQRLEILHYQKRAVAALYAWASTPKAIASPTDLVPAEQIPQPARPAPDATIEEWIYYHQQMLTVLEWQRDIEHWRESVESRLEGLEAITDLIPEILERLGPETLTIEHQRSVQGMVKRLHDATGKSFGTIQNDLKTAFDVPRYTEIREQEWDKVLNWFQIQIDRTKGKTRL